MQIGIRKIYGQNDDLQYTMCDVSDCVSFACLQLNIHNQNPDQCGQTNVSPDLDFLLFRFVSLSLRFRLSLSQTFRNFCANKHLIEFSYWQTYVVPRICSTCLHEMCKLFIRFV